MFKRFWNMFVATITFGTVIPNGTPALDSDKEVVVICIGLPACFASGWVLGKMLIAKYGPLGWLVLPVAFVVGAAVMGLVRGITYAFK